MDVGTDPTELQKRVTGACAGNNAVQGVNQNGTVGCCNPFVTSVTAGSGLLGGTVTDAGTILGRIRHEHETRVTLATASATPRSKP